MKVCFCHYSVVKALRLVRSQPLDFTLDSQSSREACSCSFSYLRLLSLAVGVLTPSGIPIIHNRIPLSRPCRREISGFLAEAVPFALLVFSCLGVPLVSAATPHLAQRFRSIIIVFRLVNTLFGNWSTNSQIGSPGPVFSLINPL